MLLTSAFVASTKRVACLGRRRDHNPPPSPCLHRFCSVFCIALASHLLRFLHRSCVVFAPLFLRFCAPAFRWRTQVADTLGAKAIVVFTSRGTTVNKAAQLRPNVPVMGVTPNIETARGLALTWGVYPAVIDTGSDDVNFRTMLFKVKESNK